MPLISPVTESNSCRAPVANLPMCRFTSIRAHKLSNTSAIFAPENSWCETAVRNVKIYRRIFFSKDLVNHFCFLSFSPEVFFFYIFFLLNKNWFGALSNFFKLACLTFCKLENYGDVLSFSIKVYNSFLWLTLKTFLSPSQFLIIRALQSVYVYPLELTSSNTSLVHDQRSSINSDHAYLKQLVLSLANTSINSDENIKVLII